MFVYFLFSHFLYTKVNFVPFFASPIVSTYKFNLHSYEFVSHFPLVLCNVFCMTIIIRDEILVPIATEGLLFSICVDV